MDNPCITATHILGTCYIGPMDQHTSNKVNNDLNTNIYSYLETCGGQSSNLYLSVVHIFSTRVY